ncbi:MAG: S8 family serine peptidase [Bacteroidia bacterium]|nr:S8 family serine peptidase [Bacteroidia bacterium]
MKITTFFNKVNSIAISGKLVNSNIYALILTISVLTLNVNGQYSDVFTMKFKSGNYLPVVNIDDYVSGKIKLTEKFGTKHYVAIQFTKLPDESVKQNLLELNVHLLDYMTGYAYAAVIPENTNFELLKKAGIRSIFALEERFKMDPAMFEGDIPEWAVKSPGTVDINLIPFEWIPVPQLKETLSKFNAEVLKEKESFRVLKLRVKQESLKALAKESWVQWMETVSPDPKDDNVPGKTLHRSNVLNDGSRNLTGDSVRIGIWDGGTVGPHLDFTGRLVLAEPYLATDHGTHVAGTMAGAGLLDPFARGMAPKARIYSYYYDGDVNNEVATAITTYSITMTQNSWGFGDAFVDCVVKDPYNSNSREQDINIRNNPTLIHVHSSGNSQAVCSGGWGTTTGKAAKNMLVVANVNSSDVLSTSSSCGPVQDGRLKPEISGMGTSVYSTLPNDTYVGGYSGTSMATPGVSGTIAQLVQRYRQLNSNNTPPASLMKALACNTAKDLGTAGPDYKYGYGRINGLQAVRALEANRYQVDSLATGGLKSFNITVPANAKRLKVMICWTDPAGAANANPALVNDLDLTVTDPSLVAVNPLILAAATPANAAVPGVDHLNNIEQVSIDNPVAGTYSLNVSGFAVPVGTNQVYAITWEIESSYIEITYPNGKEVFVPGTAEVIYWDHLGVTSTQTLQYSINNGSSWTNISTTIASTTSRYSWTVPAVITSQALIRITSGALTDMSDTLFSILGTPGSLTTAQGCTSGQAKITWTAVTNATHYDILQLDAVLGVWNVVGSNIVGTQHFVSGLTIGNTYWFTVKAKNNTTLVSGKNAIAKSILISSPVASPYVIADGALEVCPGDTLVLSGGNVSANTYSLSTIPYQTYTPTTDIGVTLSDDAATAALPIGFTFNYYGSPYTQFYIGSNGIIGFNSASLGATYTPQLIPAAAAPNGLIALAWTDLNPSQGGTITYLTSGTAPNRKLVVSYNNVVRHNSALNVNGRIELYEGSDIVEIHAGNVSTGTNTMGIENASGTSAVPVPGRNNSSWSITVPEARRFAPYNSSMTWQPGSIVASSISVTVPQDYYFSYSQDGCVSYSDTVTVTACPADVGLNLKVFIQGLYRSNGKLVSNLSATTCDTLILQLAQSNSPYSIMYTDTAVLDTAGNGSFSFPNAVNGNSYYLVLQHRNSLETWSASALLMNAPVLTYDFSSSAGSAYGSNLHSTGDGKFALWSGDIDRDDAIDRDDLIALESFINLMMYGYNNGDLTGDNNAEASDYSLIENNIPLLLQVAKP